MKTDNDHSHEQVVADGRVSGETPNPEGQKRKPVGPRQTNRQPASSRKGDPVAQRGSRAWRTVGM